MHDVWSILAMPPMPPPLETMAPMIIAGVGALLLGLALLLRGAANGRVVLALAAAASAGAVASFVVRAIPSVKPYDWVIGLSAAITVGLMTLVLSRLLWALMLGVLAGAITLGAVVYLHAGEVIEKPVWPAGAAENFAAWSVTLSEYVFRWARGLWAGEHKGRIGVAVALVAVGMVVGVLLPRLALVLASSVLGSIGVVAGACMLMWAGEVAWVERLWDQPRHLLLAVAGMSAFGIALQTYLEFIRSKPSDDEKKEAKAPLKPGAAAEEAGS